MSTSIDGRIHEMRRWTKDLEAAAKRYPDATLGEIGDDGAWFSEAAAKDANRVEFVSVNDHFPVVYRYVQVGETRVYADDRRMGAALSISVLERLLKDNPEAYAALVNAATER